MVIDDPSPQISMTLQVELWASKVIQGVAPIIQNIRLEFEVLRGTSNIRFNFFEPSKSNIRPNLFFNNATTHAPMSIELCQTQGV